VVRSTSACLIEATDRLIDRVAAVPIDNVRPITTHFENQIMQLIGSRQRVSQSVQAGAGAGPIALVVRQATFGRTVCVG